MKYSKRKSIASKVSPSLHVSSKRFIREILPYFSIIIKKDNSLSYDLDEEELKWIKQKDL